MGDDPRMAPIPGFEGYQARSDGFIISLRDDGRFSTNTEWKVLTPIVRYAKKKIPYRCVTLFRNGKRHQLRISRLVLSAFVGPGLDGYEASHINGDSMNDSIDNLAWKTHKENEADKIAHGTLLMGEWCHLSRWTELDILRLWDMVRDGFTAPQIAAVFGTAACWVRDVYRGRIWKHLRPAVIPYLKPGKSGRRPN